MVTNIKDFSYYLSKNRAYLHLAAQFPPSSPSELSVNYISQDALHRVRGY